MGKKKVVVSQETSGAENIDSIEINKTLTDEPIKKSTVKRIRKEDIVAQIMSDIAEIQNAPKVKILIHSGAGENGGDAVFVAVNGQGYLIPRDKPMLVPLPILQALENAVETRYYRDQKDGQAFGPIIERQVPRFAISHPRN